MNLPSNASEPTMYFIGVTTMQSSIMKVFPLWAKELGLKDAVIKGIDIAIHADPNDYRKCVEFIKNDNLSFGALVTTHKIDIYNAAYDYFDYLDPYAKAFGELSSISKKNDRLEGYAKDPISSGLAIDSFIPCDFWKQHKGEVFIMGAGGSALSISSYLMKLENGDNIPRKIIISNRSESRLYEAENKLGKLDSHVNVEYRFCPEPIDNDSILENIPPYSLIVNATGLGKDRPGSPLTDEAVFPENSFVWELNYRGNLDFKHQALEHQEQRNLHVEDGWTYFIHGWTQVIAEVFHIKINSGTLQRLSDIAAKTR